MRSFPQPPKHPKPPTRPLGPPTPLLFNPSTPPLPPRPFYAKQTQFQKPQNELNPLPQKALRKNHPPPTPKKQTQFKPNPTQSHRPNRRDKSNPTPIRYPLYAARSTTPAPEALTQIHPAPGRSRPIVRKNPKKPSLNYAKQTQSPKPQTEPNSIRYNDLQRFSPPRTPKKQTQFKPNQTQSPRPNQENKPNSNPIKPNSRTSYKA